MREFKNAIVITGGIATGKSTVSTLLKLHGYTIICLDDIAHKVIQDEKEAVVKLLGEGVIKESKIDRKAVGEIVFRDKMRLKELEAIVHPKIREEVVVKSRKFEEKEIRYFLDIPLFFEGSSYDVDDVLVVFAPREIQIERAAKRDGLSIEDVVARVENQLDIEKKREKAKWVIDNSGDINSLTNEVDSFVNMLREEG